MRILLIEDSSQLRRSIAVGLAREGFVVDTADDGKKGLDLARSTDYDAIILDLMLPALDGLSLLRRLREEGRRTHVLILSARDTVENRVEGLHQGADDYLTKPFAFEELVARLRALIRRNYGVKTDTVSVGDIQVDFQKRVVNRDGKVLSLPPREYSLFEFLVLQRGRVVSRRMVEDHIYGMSCDVASNAVDSAICSLRKALDRPGEPSIIKTRRGMGYVIE